jgi:signal transduction histidine kinase
MVASTHDRTISATSQRIGEGIFDPRALGGAALLAIAYYAGVHAGIALTFPSSPVAVLWPPNALLLSALLLTAPRRWWLMIAAVAPAHFAAELALDVPLEMSALWLVSNVTEAFLAATIMLRWMHGPPQFDRLRDLWVFIGAAVVIAPVASSFLDAAFVALAGWRYSDYWQVWRVRVFSNALAALVIVPPIVVWLRSGMASLRQLRPLDIAEIAVVQAAILAISAGVFHEALSFGEFAMQPYLPVVLLIWAAVRYGVRAVTLSLIVVAGFAITGVVEGRGPFTAADPFVAALGAQAFLILTAVSLLLLAASLKELRRAKAVAASNQEKLNLALEAAEMGTWEWDFLDDLITWRPVRAPQGAPRTRSRPRARLLALVHEHDREVVRRAMREALRHGNGAEIECRFVYGRGRHRWIAAKGRVQHLPGTGPRRMTGVYTDTTQKRAQEVQARAQQEQLAHMGRIATLGELSGAIAHELNQPLTSILLNAEAALRELDNVAPSREELVAMMDDIVSEDKRAGNVIRRLRSLMVRGAIEMHPLDVNECIKDALGLAHTDLVEHHVVTSTQLASGIPRVTGDRVQLLQVLLNLIVNARDAMLPVDPHNRRLRIVSAAADDHVHLQVCDTGTGLHDAEIIFTPFFSTKDHGTGMGLAICRTIIAAHGGRLWASNNSGRSGGATFHVSVPLRVPRVDDGEDRVGSLGAPRS